MPGEIRSIHRPFVTISALIGVLALAFGPAPVRANAKDVTIERVTRSGKTLSPGAAVTGTIQVFVSAKADAGLEFVRLEAQAGDDPLWYCLEQWTTGAATLSLSESRVWKTANWTDPRQECAPGMCSSCTENSDHQHGAPTSNGTHRLRVVARERGQITDENDAYSAIFPVNLGNPPTAPAWIGDPASNGKPDPSVVLRWSPSPEPDILEYQFIREDPGGRERIFAVSASNPEANGCSRVSTVAYSCANGGFSRSGNYRYALRALRRAPSGPKCALSPTACVASAVGPAKSVAITATSSATAEPSSVASDEPSSSGASPVSSPASQAPLALPESTESSDLIAPPAATTAGSSGGGSAPAIAIAGILASIVAAVLIRQRMPYRKTGSE